MGFEDAGTPMAREEERQYKEDMLCPPQWHRVVALRQHLQLPILKSTHTFKAFVFGPHRLLLARLQDATKMHARKV